MSWAGTRPAAQRGRTEPGHGGQAGTPPRMMTVVTACRVARYRLSADGERGLRCWSQRRLFGPVRRDFLSRRQVGLGVLDVAHCFFLAKTHARYLLGTAVPRGGSPPHLSRGIHGPASAAPQAQASTAGGVATAVQGHRVVRERRGRRAAGAPVVRV